MTPPPLEPPRYGHASLAELLPSALAAVGGPGTDVLGLGRHRAVVVLVADGLGWRLLGDHAEAAPFLSSRDGRAIDAVFPTTTAASLSSIGTGRTPGEHGLIGYTVGVPDEDHPLNLLTWRVGLRGGGWDARERYVPEALQPRPTVLERAQAAEVTAAAVLHPDFLDSGLTRAALRGGRRLAAPTIGTALDAALEVAAGDAPALVYTHHADIDHAGHHSGPGSDEWCAALGALDRTVERVADRLPADTALIVTADHGMVAVDDEEAVDLAEAAELLDGVRVLAGEPRVRSLHTWPGAAADVAAAWTAVLGDRAVVAPRHDAVARGWLGPTVRPEVRDRLGDVVVVATRGSLPHRDVDPRLGRQRGQHGALDRGEVEVPLIVLGGRP